MARRILHTRHERCYAAAVLPVTCLQQEGCRQMMVVSCHRTAANVLTVRVSQYKSSRRELLRCCRVTDPAGSLKIAEANGMIDNSVLRIASASNNHLETKTISDLS
jgi:hypothetical protein